MNFSQAVESCFRKYVTFSGRAARSEYWYFHLFSLSVQVILAILMHIVPVLFMLRPLFSLALLLPGLAVSVRRMHDIDRSGWWLLLCFIPLIGVIVLIVFACTKGTDGPNRFGPDPLGS